MDPLPATSFDSRLCFSAQKKKQPIPIRLTAKDLPAQVKKACACTYMFKNSGTTINIKVGGSHTARGPLSPVVGGAS